MRYRNEIMLLVLSESVDKGVTKIYNEFVLKFGFPQRVHSDQGGEFMVVFGKNSHFQQFIQQATRIGGSKCNQICCNDMAALHLVREAFIDYKSDSLECGFKTMSSC